MLNCLSWHFYWFHLTTKLFSDSKFSTSNFVDDSNLASHYGGPTYNRHIPTSTSVLMYWKLTFQIKNVYFQYMITELGLVAFHRTNPSSQTGHPQRGNQGGHPFWAFRIRQPPHHRLQAMANITSRSFTSSCSLVILPSP